MTICNCLFQSILALSKCNLQLALCMVALKNNVCLLYSGPKDKMVKFGQQKNHGIDHITM